VEVPIAGGSSIGARSFAKMLVLDPEGIIGQTKKGRRAPARGGRALEYGLRQRDARGNRERSLAFDCSGSDLAEKIHLLWRERASAETSSRNVRLWLEASARCLAGCHAAVHRGASYRYH